MKQPKALIFIVSFGIAFLFIFALFESFKHNSFSVVRPALYAKEAFQNRRLEPENYDLANANKPYTLLNDVLDEKNCLGMLDAKRCYLGSFQSRIEKTGNYKQLTNNYRHKDVESCSAPLTEFVNSFYKVEPLD
jgi:hypothetical protein